MYIDIKRLLYSLFLALYYIISYHSYMHQRDSTMWRDQCSVQVFIYARKMAGRKSGGAQSYACSRSLSTWTRLCPTTRFKLSTQLQFAVFTLVKPLSTLRPLSKNWSSTFVVALVLSCLHEAWTDELWNQKLSRRECKQYRHQVGEQRPKVDPGKSIAIRVIRKRGPKLTDIVSFRSRITAVV